MKINVLDHGYVKFVEAWGAGLDGRDNRVERDHSGETYVKIDEDFEVGLIEAARQSTQGSFRGWEEGRYNCSAMGLMKLPDVKSKIQHDDDCTWHPGDKRLLARLYENGHDTPFEFAGMVLEIQAPIFVFREWQRHRTQSYNEMSARYAPLPDLYYEPDYQNVLDRARANSSNKQAVGVVPLENDETVGFWLDALTQTYDQCEKVYQTAIKKGIPKELARLVMPVGHYSRMRASASLRNWLAFLTLRMDPNAQWEIQQYAGAVAQLVSRYFPQTWALFKRKQDKT